MAKRHEQISEPVDVSSAFLAATFVSALVDRLSRGYPRMTFHLVTGYMETLQREMNERNVDLLIVRSAGRLAEPAAGNNRISNGVVMSAVAHRKRTFSRIL
jgi:DNA-binding transcriptional LysR family regulator